MRRPVLSSLYWTGKCDPAGAARRREHFRAERRAAGKDASVGAAKRILAGEHRSAIGTRPRAVPVANTDPAGGL